MELKGKIDNAISFNSKEKLTIYNFDTFNINTCKTSCSIKYNDDTIINISKWVSPKRTRSEPFSRVYKTLSNNKTITVIPLIKDEGSDGDCDFFNPITLEWMTIMNVFVILAPYTAAEKVNNKNKITKQKFDNYFIKNKIMEIINYNNDVYNYNNNLKNTFVNDYNKSISLYKDIGVKLNVSMHNISEINSFKEYYQKKMNLSKKAAQREKSTKHALEYTKYDKASVNVKDFNNNIYYLTVDEAFYENNNLILREAKNSTKSFPSAGEIEDAFFKILLFSNMKLNIDFKTEILLTGIKVVNNCIINSDLSLKEIKNIIDKSINIRNKNKLVNLIYNFISNVNCNIRIETND